MKFKIQNVDRSINNLTRTIGYQPAYFQKKGEFSLILRLTKEDYPRFHLYVKQEAQNFIFNLHLDQKKPSYNSSHAHNGEHNGEIIEAETERIRSLLK